MLFPCFYKHSPIKRTYLNLKPLSNHAYTYTDSTNPTSNYINTNINNNNTQSSFNLHSSCTYYNLKTHHNKSQYKQNIFNKKENIIPIKLVYKRDISTHNLSRNKLHTKSLTLNKCNFSSTNQLSFNRNGFSSLTHTNLKTSASLLFNANKDLLIPKPNLSKVFHPKLQSKYPIIYNPKAFVPFCDFSEVTNKIFKNNKTKKKILAKEAQIKFEEPMSLIKRTHFSKEFQHIFETNNQITTYENKNNSKLNININKNILIRNNADKQLQQIHNDQKTKRSKLLFTKFKMTIIRAAIHFQRLNIDISEFYLHYKESSTAFVNELTSHLLTAIKELNFKESSYLLNKNKYLVLDFDFYKQTPLHWASKRNFYDLIPLIISCGANINAKDSIGRTPLHLAMELNCKEAALVLLMEGASPFKLDLLGKKYGDYCKSELMKFIIKRGMLLYGINLLGKQKKFYKNMKRGIIYFVVNEINKSVNEDFYEKMKIKLDQMVLC